MAKLKDQCECMHHIACNISKLALNGIYNLRYTVFERISLTEKKLFLKKEFPDSLCAYRNNFKQKQTNKKT